MVSFNTFFNIFIVENLLMSEDTIHFVNPNTVKKVDKDYILPTRYTVTLTIHDVDPYSDLDLHMKTKILVDKFNNYQQSLLTKGHND